MIEAGSELVPRKIFTGLSDFKIIALNPTLEEAKGINVTFKEEPVYTSVNEENGAKKIRLDFWAESSDLENPVKIVFFIEDTDKVSSGGKVLAINDYGQSTYVETVDKALEYTWFKPDGVKVSKVGEADLIDFLKAWLSIGRDSKAKIESISKLVNGDLSEITPLIGKYADRKVQALLIAKESKGEWYQNVYTKFFSRGGNKTKTYWQKHLDNSQATLFYQDSLALKEFNPLTTDNTDKEEETTNPWGK